MKTDITIYTQVYNTKPFLERCLSSVVNQTFGNFDYILIDNGCTDGSSEILRQYAKKDQRIKLIRMEENRQGFWLSIIQEYAEGRYVAFLDSDDWWELDHLERLLRIAEDGDFDIVCTGTVFHREGDETAAAGVRGVDQRIIMDPPRYAEFFPYYHVFFRTVWGKLIRWKTFIEADVSIVEREQIRNGSDTMEAFAWLRQAKRVCVDNSVLHHYLLRNKSASHIYLPNRFKSNVILHQDAIDFLAQYGPISEQNLHFLHIVYANAVSDTLDVLCTSDLALEEKLAEYCAIAEHPTTQEVYADTDEAIARCRDKLRVQMLSVLLTAAPAAEGFHKALEVAVPNCAPAVTAESVGLFRHEQKLLEALRRDNRDALVEGLLDLIEKKRYTKQYDLGMLLQNLADGNPLLTGWSLPFLRKYREIYWLLWQKRGEEALDAMTGLLLDKCVKTGVEGFLQLYLDIAAQLEHIPAFLFGKTALARHYLNQSQTEKCRAIVRELDEIGMEDNEELEEIRRRLEFSDKNPQSSPRGSHKTRPPIETIESSFTDVCNFDEEALTSEMDFSRYLDLLKEAAARYTVLIAVCDTPFGESITSEMISKLMALGLKENLYGKYRYAYAAVIDRNERIFEKLPSSRTQAVKWSGTVGDTEISLESRGYEVPPRAGKIIINGTDLSLNMRGYNIIVYDRDQDRLIDKVVFDAYSKGLLCTRPASEAQGVERFQESHPGVAVICFTYPKFPTGNLTESEKFISQNVHVTADVERYMNHPSYYSLRMFFPNEEDIREVRTVYRSYLDPSGIRRLEDRKGDLVNISMGHRVTTDQPERAERTIYIVGRSISFGYCVSDRNTTASILQRTCNEVIPEKNFIVENYGFFLSSNSNGPDSFSQEQLRILNSLPVHPGDIVFYSLQDVPEGMTVLDLSHTSCRPHSYGEIFVDYLNHLNENGMRLIADKMFELMQRENFFSGPAVSNSKTKQIIPERYQVSLETYQASWRELYDKQLSIGAVVMNCNPFTHGHRYLIEQAAARCAHLIVFLVEEDQSFFSFDERLQMVRQGTADLKNIMIIPSGQFVLSSLTFSEYFNKSELQNRTIDASQDVLLFAREVAPCLHITKRFVGSEPFDTVTRQYNSEMKRELPKYGIEVIEINRLERDDGSGAISATKVREHIFGDNLEALKSMVPTTTFEYIRMNFERFKERASKGR